MKKLQVLLCCAALASTPALAEKACGAADKAAAEKAIYKVVNWAGLYKAYQDYRHCDTDDIADLFTDSLLRLMVQWKNVEIVSGTVAKDAAYKDWIFRHLLSPAAKDDRESVYSRAKVDCPAAQQAFCTELAELVKPIGGKAKAAEPALDFAPLKPIEIK